MCATSENESFRLHPIFTQEKKMYIDPNEKYGIINRRQITGQREQEGVFRSGRRRKEESRKRKIHFIISSVFSKLTTASVV
jgi:hypothetical protein